MGNLISNYNNKLDFSKNIFIKINPKYYQYNINHYKNYLEDKNSFLVSYKKCSKEEIIHFMKKECTIKDNYLFNYNNYHNYKIINIKTDKKFYNYRNKI